MSTRRRLILSMYPVHMQLHATGVKGNGYEAERTHARQRVSRATEIRGDTALAS